MSLNVNAGNNSNKPFEQIPPGSYAARCYQIIDLGHQTVVWEGQAKVVAKVRITWELSEKMADGRPFSISQEYSASIGPKANLRKDLEAWRGRPFTTEELGNFSLENVLGAPCLLGVVHKPSKDGSKSFAIVNSIMALPKGMPCEELHNPAVKFDINNFNKEVFESLPEFIRTKILMSKEMEDKDIKEVEQPSIDLDDSSVPF